MEKTTKEEIIEEYDNGRYKIHLIKATTIYGKTIYLVRFFYKDNPYSTLSYPSIVSAKDVYYRFKKDYENLC